MTPRLIIDGHADTLHRVWEGSPRFDQRLDDTDFDLERSREAGVSAQFLAVSTICGSAYKEPLLRWALVVLDLWYRQAEAHSDKVVLARSAADLLAARQQGKLAVFLALEGGDFLDGELALLRMYHRLGVRLLGLTHFRRNALADSTREGSAGGRLTPFGAAVVGELGRLGMICDLAHASDACVEHALDIAERPVVFSHANARTLCDHGRNLTDHQLRRLADNGGLIGLSFVPFFIDRHRPTFQRFLDHLDHAVQTAGIAHVGLGSDFDGFDEPRVPGLENVLCYPAIAEAMGQRGYTDADVDRVMGGNWFRIVREVLG
jgi:membrane dipeptidase